MEFLQPKMAVSMSPMDKTQRWHAVSVVADGNACDEARAVQNVRYLSMEAPRLPLYSCANPGRCRCHYRHHADRRAGPRRAVENFRPPRAWRGEDKRTSRGRRETDFPTR